MPDTGLADDIAAFHAMRPRLLQEHGPSWVVLVAAKAVGAFPDFEAAADFALKNHAGQEFLIRHTEEATPHIPLVVVEAV